jgi:hypothetical protein
MGETCAACGAALAPAAWYCLTCGAAHAAPRPPAPVSARRASMLAGLLAVAVLGAVAGAWIEQRHSDSAAAPVTVSSIVTQTVPASTAATTAQIGTASAGAP